MKRVIVIGCPGSGKSHFSRKLHKMTSLPLHYLDMIWHKPDKTTVTREEFDERLLKIFELESWIIDGNYIRTLELRLKCCDTVFFFDLPTVECIKGVENRIGTKREDLPWVEDEFDEEFRSYIESFKKERTPMIYELLEKYKDEVNIIIFKSRMEAIVWKK